MPDICSLLCISPAPHCGPEGVARLVQCADTDSEDFSEGVDQHGFKQVRRLYPVQYSNSQTDT